MHPVSEAPPCPKEDLQITKVNLMREEAFKKTQSKSWGHKCANGVIIGLFLIHYYSYISTVTKDIDTK